MVGQPSDALPQNQGGALPAGAVPSGRIARVIARVVISPDPLSASTVYTLLNQLLLVSLAGGFCLGFGLLLLVVIANSDRQQHASGDQNRSLHLTALRLVVVGCGFCCSINAVSSCLMSARS